MTNKARALLIAVFAALSVFATPKPVDAHGERNQEPFLRMRTLHWYDVQWSRSDVNVNEEVVMSGKFRVFPDWPDSVPKPDTVFLGAGTPGPVFVKTGSFINGVAAIQSTSVELDRDYEFKTVLKGRIPGRYHVHPMLSVQEAGPLVGPGKWLEINGNAEDFVLPVTTLTGEQIENLETWGIQTVVQWHVLWGIITALWALWWIRRPFTLPRYIVARRGDGEDILVTKADRIVAAAVIVVTVLLVIAGYQWAEAKYPRTIPLQAGKVKIAPLPKAPEAVELAVENATYDVPGRSMKMTLKIKNVTNRPLQLGELTSASVRFINPEVPAARLTDTNYPHDLVNKGLVLTDNRPIAPGETRTIRVDATDAAWETERLASFLHDPDSRFGALLFFYDNTGRRYIANASGPIIPMFFNADGQAVL